MYKRQVRAVHRHLHYLRNMTDAELTALLDRALERREALLRSRRRASRGTEKAG